MLTVEDIDELASFALDLADAAREVTLPHFRSGLSVENKPGSTLAYRAYDPVTAADRDAETVIRGLIKSRYRDHGIHGEEHGIEKGSSPLTWVIDPIDGTRSFISGVPLWGTLIALNDGTRPIIGVMDQPYIGERFVGRPGGSQVQGPHGTRPLQTRDCTKLSDAIFGCTDPGIFAEGYETGIYEAVSGRARLRRFGGDCYFYCMLAAGTFDVVMEANLQAYDIQALIPIIEEAGGIVTDWEGGDAQNGGRVLCSASADLHAEVLNLIKSV